MADNTATTQYIEHGFTFSEGQLKNIARAIKNKTSVGLRIESDQITGDHILLITQTQLNKIKRNAEKGSGVVLTLSASQLKAIEKHGGILPLLSLIPLIAGVVGGVGGLAGGAASIANTVNEKKAAKAAQRELERHHKEIEQQAAQAAQAAPVIGSGCSEICRHCKGSGLNSHS